MLETSDRLTARDIAREAKITVHRLKYAIDQYDIQPVQRAGIIRLFSREQIPTILAAVRRIENRRGVVHV
jgi:hypothetical protein